MGCSAGKPLSTSPEISTSTQQTTLQPTATGKHEPSLPSNGLVDVKRSSNTSAISNSNSIIHVGIKKDSTNSIKSSESTEAPEIPNASITQPKAKITKKVLNDQVKPTREKENGSPPKKHVNTKFNRNNSTEDSLVKNVPLGQVKVQLTQSQADFFRMLDKKIEEGEDYKSDCER